jgi:hypothetical protein
MNTTTSTKPKAINYTNEYSLSPFVFHVFPDNLNRFCIILISDPKTATFDLLYQYILNSHTGTIIHNKPGEEKDTEGILKTLKEFSNMSDSEEQLKGKLAILDISKDNVFKSLTNVLSCSNDLYPEWLRNSFIRNISMPNKLLKRDHVGDWDKNYSHVIWLASSVDDIPKILASNANMIFISENEQTGLYLKKYIGIDHVIDDSDNIYVITNVQQDIKIMKINKEKFT